MTAEPEAASAGAWAPSGAATTRTENAARQRQQTVRFVVGVTFPLGWEVLAVQLPPEGPKKPSTLMDSTPNSASVGM